MITEKEVTILRELAHRLSFFSGTKENAEKIRQWTELNGLVKSSKPMILVHLWETAWEEMLPVKKTFLCESREGLFYEKQLRRRLWMAENISDDNVVEPVIRYPVGAELDPYGGLKWEISYAEGEEGNSGAGHYDPVLIDKSDIEKLGDPVLTLNRDYQGKTAAQAGEIFDGLLTPIPDTTHFTCKIVEEYSWLRGLDKIFYDLIDDPVWTHEVLQRITDNMRKRIGLYEDAGLWGAWEKSDPLGSCGLRFAPGLDNWQENLKKGGLKASDGWGAFMAEAFNNVSPEMHNEFAYTYDKQLAPLFKYNRVGCCEVLADKIDYAREIPNLRLISVSEWNDLEKAGEKIGGDYVYSYKPSGVPFVMEWDEKAIKEELDRALAASAGAPVQLVLNIGGTTGHKGREKLIKWTKIAQRSVEEYCART